MGYVSVLDENGELSTTISESILELLELKK